MINLIFASSFDMMQYFLEGKFIQGIIEYYTFSIGSLPFFGVMFLGLTMLMYVWTQSLEFVAVIWLLIGGALEIYVPAAGLSIGKALIVVAVFLIFVKLFFGKSSYA